jgi:hypothetical protein
MDPRSVIPPYQQMVMEFEDRRALQEAADTEASRPDELAARERMREVQRHWHESMTGYTEDEWEQARQAAATAVAESGRDLSQPVGSAANPERFVDWEPLQPAATEARAAEAARARYEVAGGIDAQLRRNADEARAWDSPPIMRQRRLAYESERRPARMPPRLDDGWPPGEAVRASGVVLPGGLEFQRFLSPAEAERLAGPRPAAGDW